MMLLLISIVTVYQKDLQLYIVDKVSITDPHCLTFTNIWCVERFFRIFRSNFEKLVIYWTISKWWQILLERNKWVCSFIRDKSVSKLFGVDCPNYSHSRVVSTWIDNFLQGLKFGGNLRFEKCQTSNMVHKAWA